MLDLMENAGLERLHFGCDSSTGLRAIIAIQSTARGPALGGCRFIHYDSQRDAIADAMRLAKGMSYKAAIAGIPHGGGKAVILLPETHFDRRALLQAFGRFLDQLGGQYITAIDSGTNMADMDTINRETRWVTCTSNFGDPSPYTAQGVLEGIKATLRQKYGSEELTGCRVNIQGLGNVGFALAGLLAEAGAQLTVTDLNAELVEKAAVRFDARCVSPEQIYREEANIFSPCGLGAVINRDTIDQLKVDIIAGSANNQLADASMGNQLIEKGILYAPDYVINAGGLIFVARKHDGYQDSDISSHISQIGQTLNQLFNDAASAHLPPHQLADQRAQEIINSAGLPPEV